MSDAQIFQVLGLSLFVFGFSWVINHGAYRRLIKDIAKSEGVLFLMGMLALLTGYALLALHTTDSIIITVLGWLTLIKGITIICFPAFGWNVYTFLNTMNRYFSFMPWLVLALGVASLYLGYLA